MNGKFLLKNFERKIFIEKILNGKFSLKNFERKIFIKKLWTENFH